MQQNIICKFCNKSFLSLKGLSNHLSRFHLNEFRSKEDIIYFCYKLGGTLTDELAENIAEDCKTYSILAVKNKYKLSYRTIVAVCNVKGIIIRGISDSKKLLTTQQKVKNTCVERMGVDNPSKCEIIKNKKKETFLKHYGVDNIWKSESFKAEVNNIMLSKYGKKRICNVEQIIKTNMERYGVKFAPQIPGFVEKRIKTSLEKYGTEFPIQSFIIKEKIKQTVNSRTQEQKDAISQKISKMQKERWENLSEDEKEEILKRLHNITTSNIEKRVGIILHDLDINYTHSFYIAHRQFDFLLNDICLILEVNGDYWHANPRLYKKDDVLHFPNGVEKKAERVWLKDTVKCNIAKRRGYKVVYLWEFDINKFSDEQLKTEIILLILERINELNENKINKENQK